LETIAPWLEPFKLDIPTLQEHSPAIDLSTNNVFPPGDHAVPRKQPVSSRRVVARRQRIPKVITLMTSLLHTKKNLIAATHTNDVPKLRGILKQQGRFNFLSGWIIQTMFYAAARGHEQVVSLLIESGADVNACDTWGSTMLHLASRRGDAQVVRILLEKHADVNAFDGWEKKTALHFASEEGHAQVVQLLLQKGADIDAFDTWGNKTALHYASQEGHEHVVQLLLVHDANVNARGWKKETALHIACERGHEQVVRLLLEAGADVHARDFRGMAAWDFAERGYC
jgi:hypothetical protein